MNRIDLENDNNKQLFKKLKITIDNIQRKSALIFVTNNKINSLKDMISDITRKRIELFEEIDKLKLNKNKVNEFHNQNEIDKTVLFIENYVINNNEINKYEKEYVLNAHKITNSLNKNFGIFKLSKKLCDALMLKFEINNCLEKIKFEKTTNEKWIKSITRENEFYANNKKINNNELYQNYGTYLDEMVNKKEASDNLSKNIEYKFGF